MRNLMVLLVAVCLGWTGEAQVIQLEEARLNYSPKIIQVNSNFGIGEFRINESYSGQFSANPLAFMLDNFSIQDFIKEVKDHNYDQYQVTFKSNKGYLEATFDKDGELLKNFQKFKDIKLPSNVRNNVVSAYPNWSMVKNQKIAYGKLDKVEKEIYRIKLQNAGATQKLKIINQPLTGDVVAVNY